MSEILLELSKLAGVGLVSGVFSSLIANSDFRQRKWWELRVIAYQGVIEALSDIVYYYDKHYTAAIEYTEMSEEFKKKLSDYWDEAFPRVRKASDSGAFLFSDKANAALNEFMKKETYDSWQEHLDNNLFKARTCLSTLVECSKHDLKLKPNWLKRLVSSF